VKSCNRKDCDQTNPQPLEAFAKKLRNPDGLQRECRACVRKYKKQRREELGEILLAKKRESYHRNKRTKKVKSNICHQKLRRDATELEDRAVGFNFNLRPNDFTLCAEPLSPEHRKFIERYEWLGTMGFGNRWAFTARHEGKLAGVVIIGTPNMPGKYKQYEALIQRGAAASWAPKNLNSKLVMFACNWMAQNTEKRLFVCYSDSEAGEIGTIYQACNFLYLGNKFGRKEGLKLPGGKIVTARQFTRTSFMKKWAKELGIKFEKNWLKPNGFQDKNSYPPEVREKLIARAREEIAKYPVVEVPPKGKYALILGRDKRELRALQKEIVLKSYPYPKRSLDIHPRKE
jgi:hypothetical protein